MSMKSIFRKILVGVLALMGFSGCAPKVEYGVPHASLKVNAKVVDQAGNPVGSTRLVIKNLKDNYVLSDLETEADGTVSTFLYLSYELEDFSGANVVYYKKDNPQHEGKFLDDSVKVKADTLREGDGKWFHGELGIDFNLKLRDSGKK